MTLPPLPAPVRLLADIGGTHIRLAWQATEQAALSDIRVLQCADYPDVEQAIRAYLKEVGAPPPRQAAFGMANPVTGDEVRMTNHSWRFSQRALREALGLERLLVINDFTALALSLPTLTPDLLRQVGGASAVPGAAIGLVGAGTGLGVSGLVFAPGSALGTPLSGEGGHVTLAPETRLEFDILEHLQQRYGHVSAERVVSGPGLVDLYHALRSLRNAGGTEVTQAAQVSQRALQDGEPLALEALSLFCGFLGNVAGSLALTLGARGGVYIGGGIVPRLGDWFDQSPFRARFEAKGRFRAYLAEIPCWVIDARANPALQGVARALSAGA
ncbi:MAG: glucokinase [Curvibacter sp.]|nr:glucokinase [Curvibacter sp.]